MTPPRDWAITSPTIPTIDAPSQTIRFLRSCEYRKSAPPNGIIMFMRSEKSFSSARKLDPPIPFPKMPFNET